MLATLDGIQNFGTILNAQALKVVMRRKIKSNSDKETFGYKKRFHSSASMQDKLSMLIHVELIKTMDERNSFLNEFLSEFDCITSREQPM